MAKTTLSKDDKRAALSNKLRERWAGSENWPIAPGFVTLTSDFPQTPIAIRVDAIKSVRAVDKNWDYGCVVHLKRGLILEEKIVREPYDVVMKRIALALGDASAPAENNVQKD